MCDEFVSFSDSFVHIPCDTPMFENEILGNRINGPQETVKWSDDVASTEMKHSVTSLFLSWQRFRNNESFHLRSHAHCTETLSESNHQHTTASCVRVFVPVRFHQSVISFVKIDAGANLKENGISRRMALHFSFRTRDTSSKRWERNGTRISFFAWFDWLNFTPPSPSPCKNSKSNVYVHDQRLHYSTNID